MEYTDTSYNKSNKTVTKLGNWVEEEALRAATGLARYEPWVDKAEPLTRKAGGARRVLTDTAARVINHSNAEQASAWRSTTKATVVDPRKNALHRPVPKVGTRSRLLEQELLRQAAEDVRAEREATEAARTRSSLDSTSRTAFVPLPAPDPASLGRRVMRTPDGLPARRDEAFLAEMGLKPRSAHVSDAELLAMLPRGSYVEAAPVTYYSQRLAESVFPASAVVGRNPFARSCAFTNDIADPRCSHVEAMERPDAPEVPCGRGIAPAPGSALVLLQVLQHINEELATRCGRGGAAQLADALRSTAGGERAGRTQLRDALRRVGVRATEHELDVLLAHLRRGAEDEVVELEDLLHALRRCMNERRRGQVHAAFHRLDRLGRGAVSVEAARAALDAAALPTAVRCCDRERCACARACLATGTDAACGQVDAETVLRQAAGPDGVVTWEAFVELCSVRAVLGARCGHRMRSPRVRRVTDREPSCGGGCGVCGGDAARMAW